MIWKILSLIVFSFYLTFNLPSRHSFLIIFFLAIQNLRSTIFFNLVISSSVGVAAPPPSHTFTPITKTGNTPIGQVLIIRQVFKFRGRCQVLCRYRSFLQMLVFSPVLRFPPGIHFSSYRYQSFLQVSRYERLRQVLKVTFR